MKNNPLIALIKETKAKNNRSAMFFIQGSPYEYAEIASKLGCQVEIASFQYNHYIIYLYW